MDPLAKVSTGCWLCAVFTVCSFTEAMLKRTVIQTGLEMSLKVRKILMASIYDKIGKLSMKAVTSTNSGKLISLISADCFMLERGMAFAPFVFTTPLTNIAVMIFLAIRQHWSSAVVVLVFFVLMLVAQNLNGAALKNKKVKESLFNDKRIKLVSDMVNGIRTIKSYGWENHY
jgi:ABC-type multidrug transport system fused ATPase/permease subunit